MNNDLKPALLQVPVLLIFFTRPDTFKEVFAKVKEARPKQLFLACDGSRADHPQDAQRIAQCKQIAEDIDWECEVHQNYAEDNMGCGMRPQTAISWAFESVDSLIILEDDCVPHPRFFPFMEEMMLRYQDDERIGVICGFNHFLNWDCGEYSYFYTTNGPLAGAWGTWKRVWEHYDYTLSDMKSPLVQQLIYNSITFKRAKQKKVDLFLKTAEKIESGENISYWDVQFGYLKLTQSILSVVPRFSLVSNIGLGAGSTHAQNAKNAMPSIFFSEERKLDFPLRHPPFVICDRKYDDTVDAKWGYPHPLKKNFYRVVRLIKRILRVG